MAIGATCWPARASVALVCLEFELIPRLDPLECLQLEGRYTAAVGPVYFARIGPSCRTVSNGGASLKACGWASGAVHPSILCSGDNRCGSSRNTTRTVELARHSEA